MRNSYSLGKSLVIVGSFLGAVCDSVWAATTYNYTGLNFTSVTGTAPQVTTSNHLSGFVTFATAPTPNGSKGPADITAFSMTDGVRTLSSANGDHQFFISDFFNFDASLHIVNWQFSCVPDNELGNTNSISTQPTSDVSRLDAGNTQDARNNGGGSWAAVPEPAGVGTIALGGLVLAARRRRG